MYGGLPHDLGAELEAVHAQIDFRERTWAEHLEPALAVSNPLPGREEREDIPNGVEDAANGGNVILLSEAVGEDNVHPPLCNGAEERGDIGRIVLPIGIERYDGIRTHPPGRLDARHGRCSRPSILEVSHHPRAILYGHRSRVIRRAVVDQNNLFVDRDGSDSGDNFLYRFLR